MFNKLDTSHTCVKSGFLWWVSTEHWRCLRQLWNRAIAKPSAENEQCVCLKVQTDRKSQRTTTEMDITLCHLIHHSFHCRSTIKTKIKLHSSIEGTTCDFNTCGIFDSCGFFKIHLTMEDEAKERREMCTIDLRRRFQRVWHGHLTWNCPRPRVGGRNRTDSWKGWTKSCVTARGNSRVASN